LLPKRPLEKKTWQKRGLEIARGKGPGREVEGLRAGNKKRLQTPQVDPKNKKNAQEMVLHLGGHKKTERERRYEKALGGEEEMHDRGKSHIGTRVHHRERRGYGRK